MFSFSYNQKMLFTDLDSERKEANKTLSQMIIDFYRCIQKKVNFPGHASGMYLFRDFED